MRVPADVKTWGDYYNWQISMGHDHGSAAYSADEWEKRRGSASGAVQSPANLSAEGAQHVSEAHGKPTEPNNSSNPDQRGTLSEQLEEAVRAREAMSPVDRALHDSDQRRSFVRGQCGRDPGPDVLAEEVQRLRAEVTRLSAERDEIVQALAFRGNATSDKDRLSWCVAVAIDTFRSRAGAAEGALTTIGAIARSDGGRTLDDMIRDLGWIDDECRRFRTNQERGNG